MHTTTIIFHRNQSLEIYAREVRASPKLFEVWMVGEIKDRRTVIAHYLSRDDLRKRMCYAKAGDLVWTEATEENIPQDKTASAVAWEKSGTKQGIQQEMMVHHLFSMVQLPCDRKALNLAKKTLVGKWTDGIAAIEFEPEGGLMIEVPLTEKKHPLWGVRHVQQVDNWSFGRWTLWMMNHRENAGSRMAVFNCSDSELHLPGSEKDCLVHVFQRA